ncbi:MAG: family 16 glycosylhydrolase [Acetanaerobacterium sp.]
MKKALLILIGILISTGFTLYFLHANIRPTQFTVAPDYGNEPAGDAVETDLAVNLKWAEAPQETSPKASVLAGQTAAVSNIPADAENGWALVWEDDFDQKSIDLEYWTEVGRRDNYNGELQYYTPDNSYIQDGCLYLTAKREDHEGKQYTSATVETMDKLSVCLGRVEARISLPVGKGLFPAFWLLAYSGESEIDIMEMIGSEPQIIYGVNHYDLFADARKTFGQTCIDVPGEFHVYAMEWEDGRIRWYVDDKLYYSTTQGVTSEEMYIIFTLAVGGEWPGDPDSTTVFPNSMAIDYVRVYEWISCNSQCK